MKEVLKLVLSFLYNSLYRLRV